MKLTATKLRKIKPTGKAQKLSDGGGLYLFVSPKGACSWRYKYRFHGKEQLMTLGKYPQLSLADARDLHKQAQAQLQRGTNPSQAKKQASEHTFESVARR